MAVRQNGLLKKVLIGAVSAAVLVGLTACSVGVKPSKQVSAELDKIKESELSADEANVFGDNETLKDKYGEDYRAMVAKLREFDYEIKEEQLSEDGKSATVSVTITTYDFGEAYRKTNRQAAKAAKKGKIDDKTDVQDYVYELLLKNMNAVTEKSYSKDVNIECSRNDKGDWSTGIGDNEALQDAIMGGYLSAVQEIAKG